MRTKRLFASLVAGLALAVFPLQVATLTVAPIALTGCGTLNPEANALVVRAEQLDEASFDIVSTFWVFEKENRDALWKLNPGIKGAADKLRAEFPLAHAELKSMTRLYKQLRDDTTKTDLEKVMAVVKAMKDDAIKWHAAGKL
jgi:hypothetical protein